MTDIGLTSPRYRLLPMWERHYPAIFGALSAILWFLLGYKLVCYAELKNWHFDQIYVAFFGFASITTGFLATFYGTIQSMSTGFVQRIHGTKALSGFTKFAKRAIIMGFVGCILTVPMLIIQTVPKVQYSAWSVVVALWFGIAVWAIAGFWRVASSLFLVFEAGEGNRPAG
jgi:hypothetical protein